MNILGIAAHPDDLEVGCFGTLLRHSDNGDNVYLAITTKGGYSNRTWTMITNEMEKVEGKSGFQYIVLDNKVGHIQMNWKTVKEVDNLIEEFDIDTVYTNWYGDYHQDHQETYKIVLAACRTKVHNLLCFEISTYSNRSHLTFNPTYYVDISQYITMKLDIAKLYKSYINDQHLNAIKGLAQHRGLSMELPYAEAFEVIFISSLYHK